MVAKRDLQFIRDDGCRNRIYRFLDQMERASYHGGIEETDFYDPYTIGIAISMMEKEPGLSYLVAGGYQGAERQRICLTYGEKSWLSDGEISLFQGETKNRVPSHREILGSLMGLGLERAKFGDIIVTEDHFFVFMSREVENYVLSQFQEIGSQGIQGRLVDLKDFIYARESGEIKRVSTASFRLDAVVSALIPTNRGRAQEMIKKEMVKINHRLEKRSFYEISPGDLISIRGSGRFQLGTEWKESKKGRLHFEAEKF